MKTGAGIAASAPMILGNSPSLSTRPIAAGMLCHDRSVDSSDTLPSSLARFSKMIARTTPICRCVATLHTCRHRILWSAWLTQS